MSHILGKEFLFELIDKLEESSINELEINDGDAVVSLVKRVELPPEAYPAAPVPMAYPGGFMPPAPAAAPPSAGTEPAATAAPAPAADEEIVTAPLVGTFYRAAAPDAPPFVDIGDRVEAGKTLCILEAMKTMNEFSLEYDCVIKNILVENGAMVEFGMPLFEVKKL